MSKIYPLFIFGLFLCKSLCAIDLRALYLTWTQDPTTTMVIQWHTGAKNQDSTVFYRERGSQGPWLTAEGRAEPFQTSDLLVHRLELQRLMPDTEYVFRLEDNAGSKEYWFRTMPAQDNRPIHFVVAGDVYYFYYLFAHMNSQIAKADPDFVVMGGDIAYTEHHPSFFKGAAWQLRRWHNFLDVWRTTLVGKEGRLIPFLPVIGNHDIKKKISDYVPHPEMNPAFFQLFAMPEEKKAYRTLDFGNYLSLFLLDTGHYSSITGEQTEWLREALSARGEVPMKLAVYHIPAYPAVYNYAAATPRRIRYQWVPLFEQYGIDTAFEHHSHAYKRTFRIKEGNIDPTGVQYLGDGCWGTAPRTPKRGLWYMARAEKLNHFWEVTLLEGDIRFESRDIYGRTIEVVTSSSNRSNSVPERSTNLGSASAESSLCERSDNS